MGIMLCPKHGRTGIMFVCPHVSSAVASNIVLSGIICHQAAAFPSGRNLKKGICTAQCAQGVFTIGRRLTLAHR